MVNLKNALPKLLVAVALVVGSVPVLETVSSTSSTSVAASKSSGSKDKGSKSSKDKGSKSSKDKGSKSSKDKGSKSGGTKTVSATPTPAASAIPCEPPTDPTPAPSSIQMVYGFGVEVVSFQEIPVDSGNPAPQPSDNAAGGA